METEKKTTDVVLKMSCEKEPPFFVNVRTPMVDSNADGKLRNVFDFTIPESLFEEKSPMGHPLIYENIVKFIKKSEKKCVVTMCANPSISSATIAGFGEKNVVLTSTIDGKPKYYSNLKIIYIDSFPDLRKQIGYTVSDYSNSVVSNLMYSKKTFTKHKIDFTPDQFIFLGLDDKKLTYFDKNMLTEKEFEYYTIDTIRKKNLDDILDRVIDTCDNIPVHIVFDLSVCDLLAAPCISRHNYPDMKKIKNGLNSHEISKITTKLSSLNIIGIDITGYDLRIPTTELAFKITCDTVRTITKNLLNLTEKKINIYNEHSRFLIYRPLNDPDFGWKIFRFVPKEIKEMLLEQLKDDTIIQINTGSFEKPILVSDEENDDTNIDMDDILLTSTTMEYQEKMVYLPGLLKEEDIYKCILYPDEKTAAPFQMLL